MSSVDPDKAEPTVIRGAKMTFEPVRGYPADAQTLSRYAMSARIGAEMYQRWIDDNPDIRVISVCGYNPQKLLPAPRKSYLDHDPTKQHKRRNKK